MLKLSRILRDYQDAGGVNNLLGLWGFVDDSTFLTKAGHVGQVYRIHGIDAEGLTHVQRAAIVHRVEAALRLLDEHCRVYQYVIKRRIDPLVSDPCRQPIAHEAIQRRTAFLNARRDGLYSFDLYLALVYEAANRGADFHPSASGVAVAEGGRRGVVVTRANHWDPRGGARSCHCDPASEGAGIRRSS